VSDTLARTEECCCGFNFGTSLNIKCSCVSNPSSSSSSLPSSLNSPTSSLVPITNLITSSNDFYLNIPPLPNTSQVFVADEAEWIKTVNIEKDFKLENSMIRFDHYYNLNIVFIN
jgi:hypothetical protein